MVSYVEKNRNRKAEGKAQNETAQPNSRDISREATHEVHGVEDEKVNEEPKVEEAEDKPVRKRRTKKTEENDDND